MLFEDDIQAWRRGELDQEGLLGRVRSYLRRSGSDPAKLREALDEARRSDHITSADYDLLTQCIADASEAPAEPEADRATEVVSREVELDDSMTRLATTADVEEGGQANVDVGSRLRDRFILDEVIGVGGMGTVYRGRDVLKIEAQDRNPYVAIKILNDSFKQRPDAFIVLQREASRQQRLAHPNVATVYDFDRTGGVMFITMEYLDGVSLDQYIKQDVRPRGGLPLTEALPIIEGMCSALAHAHARNIIHADFKPGNCFITSNRQLKVLDFGIARAMKDPARGGDETLFDPRSIGALTPAYASPEMLENNADADPRDDIYGLACVCYELLSGRHPFHRIPGDQAKANGLKPDRIKHLTRRQNDALARALAFERSRRTATVQEFLEGLGGAPSRAGNLRTALAVGAGALVVAAAMIAPGIVERWNGDALIEEIGAGRVAEALAELDGLSRQQYIRVLQEGRIDIQRYFEGRFERLMGQPDPEVDFGAVEQVLAEASELYPDSAALRELSDRFHQRREAYLSRMAQDFERFLEPDFLLPQAEGNDLPELLARLAAVDATNPLLEDSRISGAYADSIEAALTEEDYGTARRFLDAGLALAPADPTLADLRDRVLAAERRLEREAAIAGLTRELEAGAEQAESLSDAEALLPVVAELASLEPDSAAISAVGEKLASRLSGELAAAREAERLPEVESYLRRAEPIWSPLGQMQMIAPAEARRAALIDRREDLISQARLAIREPDMLADDGRSVTALIAEARSVDPDDARPAVLLSEIVQARRERAERALAEAEWETARAELAALDEVPLSAEQREAVSLDLARIDRAEQRAAEQAEAAVRLAEAQRRAARERQERERLEQLAAERAARIADAAERLERSLADFDHARPVPAIREILDRMNALATLQPDHALLTRADGRLGDVVAQAVARQPTVTAGLELVDTAEGLIGARPAFTELRNTLEAQLETEQAAARRAAIASTETRLRQTLDDPAALAEDTGRERARRALVELTNLLEDDADAVAAARRSYVAAHLAAADRLLADKRFSVAERVIDAAAGHVPEEQSTQVAQARAALESARQSFRQERTRQEQQARIEALAQRFSLEVNSGQLTRARQTLTDYRQLDPDGRLAGGEGAQRLAAGYHRIARQRLDAGNFDGARALITTGLGVLPGYEPLERLDEEVERLSLLARISDWFGGASSEPVAAVRPLLRRYRAMDPDEYANQEVAWAASAARHLRALENDADAYNRFLQDARSLLSNQGPLESLAMILPSVPEPRASSRPAQPEVADTIPAVVETPAPQLSSTDLLGRWCADNIEIEFQRSRMVFILDGGQADYRVRGYDVNGDTIFVNWEDRRLGPMVFEFGRFTDARDRMVQLRGRPAGEDDWQTYNRDFLRCG